MRRTRVPSRKKTSTKHVRYTKRRYPRRAVTFIEKRMREILLRLGLSFIEQLRVPRQGTWRSYYIDFALPGRIAIECDGKAWHSGRLAKARDRRRQTELEAQGWCVLRFTGSQIVTNPKGCARLIRQTLEEQRT